VIETVFALDVHCMYATMHAYKHATHEVYKSERVAKKDEIQLEVVVILLCV